MPLKSKQNQHHQSVGQQHFRCSQIPTHTPAAAASCSIGPSEQQQLRARACPTTNPLSEPEPEPEPKLESKPKPELEPQPDQNEPVWSESSSRVSGQPIDQSDGVESRRRSTGPQKAENHSDHKPAASIQELVRPKPEAVSQSARSSRKRNWPQRANCASLVPEPAGQAEKDATQTNASSAFDLFGAPVGLVGQLESVRKLGRQSNELLKSGQQYHYALGNAFELGRWDNDARPRSVGFEPADGTSDRR